MMSTNMMSGWWSAIFDSASNPSIAVMTWQPSFVSSVSAVRRIVLLSSTTRILSPLRLRDAFADTGYPRPNCGRCRACVTVSVLSGRSFHNILPEQNNLYHIDQIAAMTGVAGCEKTLSRTLFPDGTERVQDALVVTKIDMARLENLIPDRANRGLAYIAGTV